MIKTKKDLKEYIREDKKASGIKRRIPLPFCDYRYKYLVCMRKVEYYKNRKSTLRYYYYKYKLYCLRYKTGFSIAKNTFGKGLGLFHNGTIIVNNSARFGDYCIIKCGVNVAADVKGGNFVYLAPGAKVNEKVVIPDHVIVGSNCVVTKSSSLKIEENTTIAGGPAKKISNKGFWRK